MQKDTLTYASIYSLLRADINRALDQWWGVRTWAIALAGAIHTIALPVLELTAEPGQARAAALALCAGAVLNGILTIVVHNQAHGVFNMGAYLKWIESKSFLPAGWEHFVWYDSSVRHHPLREMISEPLVWLAWSYVIALRLIPVDGVHDRSVGLVVASIVVVLVSVATMRLPSRRRMSSDKVESFVRRAEAADQSAQELERNQESKECSKTPSN